jgi:S1-C subfamily serine protease
MDNKIQTIFIVGMTLAALVGAVFGSFATFTFSREFSLIGRFGSGEEKQVEQKIVELIEEESATIAVVQRVTPAVVSIVVKKPRAAITPRTRRILLSPFFIQQVPEFSEEEGKQLVEISSGSGFLVTEDGYVLTNRHVVDEQGATFFVVTNEGKELPAKLIDTDPFLDIAVLQVEVIGFPIVTLGDSDNIQIGQTVIAIGNTLSEFRNTVTKGVISGINRRVTAGSAATADVIEQAIQTDAAINPGNSGGPLINLRGEVVGINTAVSIEGEAIAFAIPINQAKRAIDDVRASGRIIRPWLGVRYVLVQNEKVDTNVNYEVGAMIVAGNQLGQPGVIPGSPAAEADLKEGDVIIKIGGTTLSKEDTLSELISVRRPGETIELEVLRDGVLLKLNVTLAEYNP